METSTYLILPVSLIVGGLLAGLIFEKIILVKLKSLAEKTKWEGDEIIIVEIRGMTILWFTLGGIYCSINSIPALASFLNIIQRILLIIFILSITFVTGKIAVGFVNLYTKKVEGILPPTTIFANLTKLIVFVIGGLIVLNSLGISITPILTALGVGGLAVALALQDTLSNIFSGIHILISRKIRPGDYVKLDSGEEGCVFDITWRNTTIKALPNNMIIIPNSKLGSAIITNYSLPEKEMSVLVQVGVSYGSDLKKVERVTIDVAKEIMKDVNGGVPSFEPFIRYHTFSDSSINFSVILRAREFVDQYLIKHEFVKRLHERYSVEGIEIPFPIRTVYMKKSENV